MGYQIYESHNGDMRKFTYPKELFYYGGKEYYSNIRYYLTDYHYKKYWIAVCSNGQIIKIEPMKISKLLREKKVSKVGNSTSFHSLLSQIVFTVINTGVQKEKEVKAIMENRKRNIWTKEYRGA